MNSLELDLPEIGAARVRILGLSGSLRAASINSALLRAAARLAPPGVRVVPSGRLRDLPLFNADDEPDPPANVEAFRAEVARADALMVASPEYAHGVSGTIKNALDWLVGFAPFAGKPVAVLNASPRAHHADAALRETLRTMAAVIVERASIAIPLLGRNLDDQAMASTRSVAEPISEALAALIAAVSGPHGGARTALTIRKAVPADDDALVDIWLRSVRATHTFLAERDIQSLIPVVRKTALRNLELWVLCTEDAEAIGFMGLAGPSVEALFIAPEWMHRGGGRMLLHHARRLKGALSVEVNETKPAGNAVLCEPGLRRGRSIGPGPGRKAVPAAPDARARQVKRMSGHSVIIRPGEWADVPDVENIELDAATMFPPADLPPELARRATAAELMSRIAAPLLWVAEIASAGPVGFVLCGSVGRCLHIHEIDVRPSYGRRGIGSRLLAQAGSAATNTGLTCITLTTFSHLRWNAPFYFRRGFSVLRRPARFPHLAMALRREKERGLENRVAIVRRQWSLDRRS